MTASSQPGRRRALGAGPALLTALLVGATALAPASAAAAAEAPTGLTIEISDAVDEVSPGGALTVEATLTNSGADAVDATVVLTAPGYASYAASDDAAVSGSDASWVVSVASGESRTVTATLDIGEIPESEFQLATIASVYVGDASAPVVRAADVNTIPDRENPAEPTIPVAAAEQGIPLAVPMVGIAAAVLLAAVAGTLVILARRRRASDPA
ncbi:hypothetical protein [Microbacterium phyllosphaerae]|uniref:hypothetical protein n=1 Tax=Microbacterium phyllosphaerae TaxID=124798 RepID=UPI003D660CFB